jgi:hypothetical protein
MDCSVRTDAEEDVAGLDVLPLADIHGRDDAGNVGRYHQLRRVHIGVVDGDPAAAPEPQGARRDGNGKNAAEHEDGAQSASAAGRRLRRARDARLDRGDDARPLCRGLVEPRGLAARRLGARAIRSDFLGRVFGRHPRHVRHLSS